MKNLQNVKNEYGCVLRWYQNGEKMTYYLDFDGDHKVIDNQEALNYILKMTINAFKNDVFVYDHYVKLFSIIGILPKKGFKSLLDDKGISSNKLAKQSGVSQPIISQWTNGVRNPLGMSIDNAAKISKALGIKIDDLYEAIN